MSYDRYVYPGTNVLINKFGIMDAAALEKAERVFSSDCVLDLEAGGVNGRFDVQHLKDIHRTLFGDVYDWAGEFREIQIWKGGTEFAAPELIQTKLEDLFDRIKDQNYFRDLDHDSAANAMADVMAELNLIHPFREGNGRTQRAFIGQLAMNAGYDLDFTKMSDNDMRNASMAASIGRGNLMRYLFRNALSERIHDLGPIKATIEPAPDVTGQQSVRSESKSYTGAFAKLKLLLKRRNDFDNGCTGCDGPDR